MNTNAALVNVNVRWLQGAVALLERIDERAFTALPRTPGACRISSQFRHVIEFYECFLAGLESTHIDYDARQRDLSIEASREAAITRLQALTGRLQTSPASYVDSVLFVRIEDADALNLGDPYLMSTTGRELLALSTHTVHHFALIATMLRALGVVPDPDFGVAPSTLRHRERNATFAAHEAA